MISCNPYLTRFIVKTILLGVTIVFFISHSWYLTNFRSIYIQRYMQYQMHAGANIDDVPGINLSNMEEDHNQHHHQQNHKNQHISMYKNNSNEETRVLLRNEPPDTAEDLPPPIISGGDEEFDDAEVYTLPPLDKIDPQLQEKVLMYSWVALLIYIAIETIELVIYLVIIVRRQFCYMCILTVLNSILLVNAYNTVFLHQLDEPRWMDGIHFGKVVKNPTNNETITFMQHVNSLSQEETLSHLMMPTLIELVLATIETILFFVFLIICIFYPEPYDLRQHRYNQIRQRQLQAGEAGLFIPNGHHHPIRDDPEEVEMLPINRDRHPSDEDNQNVLPAPEVERQVEVAALPKDLNQV